MKWVKFELGATNKPWNLGYGAGEVAELETDLADRLMKAKICVPASAEEITKAKAAIEAEKTAAPAAAAAPPANWQEQMETMQKQISDLAALAAKK